VLPAPRCLHAPPLLRSSAPVATWARFARAASTLALIELALLYDLHTDLEVHNAQAPSLRLPLIGAGPSGLSRLAFNDLGTEQLGFSLP